MEIHSQVDGGWMVFTPLPSLIALFRRPQPHGALEPLEVSVDLEVAGTPNPAKGKNT